MKSILSVLLGLLILGAVIPGAFAVDQRLPAASPSSMAVDERRVDVFLDRLSGEVDAMHGLVLVRGGHRIVEASWAPYSPERRHTLYSLSKSFTSVAVGMAVDEGLLSLDDTVLSFFPAEAPAEPGRNLRSMRVRDLLMMSTGHMAEDLREFTFETDESLVRQFLALPVALKPGTHFLYNTPATYMCSAILTKVTGGTLLDYLRPRLFEPLGIIDPVWDACADGINYGGYGLHVRTGDIAVFGQMLLQGGLWKGRRIVPESYVNMATARQTSNGSNPDSDWDQGYGFQFWRCRHNAWRGDGAFGQFCIVLPEHDVVIAINSGTGDMQKVLNLVWDELLPAFGDLSSSPRPEGRTMQRRHVLPLIRGQGNSTVAEKITGIPFDGDSIQVTFVEQSGDGVTGLILKTGEVEYPLVCRPDRWTYAGFPALSMEGQKSGLGSSAPAALSGAWVGDGRFRMKAWMIETPFAHQLDFQFSDNGSELTVSHRLNVSLTGRRDNKISLIQVNQVR